MFSLCFLLLFLNNNYEILKPDIRNINKDLLRNDFKIIFKNAEFSCPILFAELLSPKIISLRKNDPSIQNITLNLHLNESSTTLSRLQQLINGENVSFFKINNRTDELITILLELDNFDIIQAKPCTELTLENVYFLLTTKKHYHIEYKKEINFFAKNFYFLRKQIVKLEIYDIISILESSSLLLPYEFCLVSVIRDLILQDKKYISLIKYIHFECLTQTQFDSFIKIIDNLDPIDIKNYWPSIKESYKNLYNNKFMKHNSCSSLNRYMKTIEINYSETQHFNGVFQFLLEFTDGHDLYKEGLVTGNFPINNYTNISTAYHSLRLNFTTTPLKCIGLELKTYTNEAISTDDPFWYFENLNGSCNRLRLFRHDEHLYVEISSTYSKSFTFTEERSRYCSHYLYFQRFELYGTLDLSHLI